MDLLQEILARSQAPQPAYDPNLVTDPDQQKQSLLEWLTGAKIPGGIKFIGSSKPAFPEVATQAPSPLQQMAPQAGLIAPGIGGLGNMAPSRTGAPVIPTDPNYADPNNPAVSPTGFDTPEQRALKALNDPQAQNAVRPPVPRERPQGAPPRREADGSSAPEAANDVSSRGQTPAQEDDAAAGPDRRSAIVPPNAEPTAGTGGVPGMPQGLDLAGMLGGIGGKIMPFLHDNSSTLLALAAGFAGAPNIGQGISRAAQFAIPASQQDLKNQLNLQNQSTVYQALRAANVPHQLAIAAVGNPDLQKKLFDQYLVDRKHEVKEIKEKDSLGNETTRLVAYNPYDLSEGMKELTPPQGTGGDGVSQSSAQALHALSQIQPMYNEQGRDENFMAALQKIDPTLAADVKAATEGKLSGTGRNMQQIMKLAPRYEENFEGNRFRARADLEKSYFGGGEGFKALRSANTTIDHGLKLETAIKDLHNYSIAPQYTNKITGAVAKQYDKNYQNALKNFKVASEVYSKELNFALTGKDTVSGVQHIREMFDPNASTNENMTALQSSLQKLEERINEHEHSYQTGMNRRGGPFLGSMITKRAELDRLIGGGGPNAAPAAAPGALPKPGGKYIYDPKTGGFNAQ